MQELPLDEIHWHDSEIREVRLMAETDCVEMVLNYPEDWNSSVFRPHLVRFIDAYGYKEYEGAFFGCPTALSAESQMIESGWHLVRIETNAGNREIFCKAISLHPLPSGG